MKNKKGFTLIESIITFAILAIAGLMLMSLTSNVIHLMKESAFIKNETDLKYSDVQVGMNVDINENAEISLVLDDGQPPIKSTVKGTRTQKLSTDNFDFQLSKIVADSDWLEDAKGEMVDATFVIIKDITKYKLVDGEGNIVLNKGDYLDKSQGILVPKSLDTSIGNEMVTILSKLPKPMKEYLANPPTFNEFNPNLEMPGYNFDSFYLKALRDGFKDELDNETPIPIDWVAIDPIEKIVYGIIIPEIPENPDEKPEGPGDVLISVDGDDTKIKFDKNTTKIQKEIKGGPHPYDLYIDGKFVKRYTGGELIKDFNAILDNLLQMPEYKNARLVSLISG